MSAFLPGGQLGRWGILALVGVAGCAQHALPAAAAAPNTIYFLSEFDTNRTLCMHVGDELMVAVSQASSAQNGRWQLQQPVGPTLVPRYYTNHGGGRVFYFFANTAGTELLSLIPIPGRGYLPNFTARIEVVAANAPLPAR